MVLAQCDYEHGTPGVTTTTTSHAGNAVDRPCPNVHDHGDPTTDHVDDCCAQAFGSPHGNDVPEIICVNGIDCVNCIDIRYRDDRGDRVMTRRIRWFGLAMILLFSGLLIQLDNIQGLKASQLQSAADNPITTENEYAKPRGTIESSDEVVLAKSMPTPNGETYKYQREYPTGPLFAQIVGFTSYRFGDPLLDDTYGGVEAEYNKELTFHTQSPRTLGDLLNTEQGTDTVVLTVNDKLQALARQALAGRDGAVVMLNPTNGDVLAMYSNPSFDPNPIASQSWNDGGGRLGRLHRQR